MPAGSNSEDSEASARQDAEPFFIEQAAAYYHPDPTYHRNLYVQLVFDTLFVNGPAMGQSGWQVVADLPSGKWTQLKDVQGQDLPVAIMRDDFGRLRGAWL
jgi:hypothetical protein